MATPTVYTPKRLFDAQELGTSLATLYTSPAGQKGTQLKSLIVVNTSGADRTVDIHLIKTGGSGNNTNAIMKTYTLPNDGLPYDIMKGADYVMDAGDFIQAKASAANAVTIHGSGVELN